MSLLRDKILKSLLHPNIEKFLEPIYLEAIPLSNPLIIHSISICTTCMGRANDIKQTFLLNISDNLSYSTNPEKNLEFLLLDYNSKDDLEKWAKKNLKKLISKGLVTYYKTTEPQFYSMTHSRNIAFKLAKGYIVNNVDADHFTNFGFCSQINALANQFQDKTVFVKSRQKNRGRLSFFKDEFISLGGYDEGLEGYGFDDKDLLYRAVKSGFRVVRYGGKFFRHTSDHVRHPVDNYKEKDKDWKFSQRRNTILSILNILSGRVIANEGKEWGKAKLVKNFEEKIII